MKLIVGLGNPGDKYNNNRHNVGYIIADKLKAQSSKLKDIVVLKTNTYMNNSGEIVKKLVAHYKIKMPNLWVIHDDLDLQLGSYKIQKGKGPREHKGLLSIENELGTKDFWRVRLGIENREDLRFKNYDLRTRGEDYVLQDFTEKELEILEKTIDNVVEELLTILS